MVLVRPTARWLGKTQRIPRGRKINRNGMNGTIEVSQAEADYLMGFFFVSVVDAPVKEGGNPLLPAELESGVPDVLGEGSALSTLAGDLVSVASVASNESLVLDYLNTNDSETIARQIKGIGQKTADDLVMACPLNWKSVQAILSDRQLDAVTAFVTTPVNIHVETSSDVSTDP